jgi:hypothetical protein
MNEDMREEEMTDNTEAIEEREEEEDDQAERPGPVKHDKLSKILKACFAFCIALLSQSVTSKEYVSPSVCAWAVLGVKEDEWKGPEQYPHMLPAVIKVAWFMVLQQASEFSEPFGDDVFDDDKAYESDSSGTIL